MKFLITKVFLAALALGQSLAVEKMYGARVGSDNEEDAPFWSGFLVQGVDSMAEPTNKPSAKPIEITSEPTDRPSIESNMNTPIQVDPTPYPSTSAPSASITGASSVSSSRCNSIGKTICSVPEFSTLCELAGLAGLSEALDEDIFTIFAPTNDAFDSLVIDLPLNDVAFLRSVLLYHTVPEVKILAENLACDGKIMMGSREDTTTICNTTNINTGGEIYQVGSGNVPNAYPQIIGKNGEACNGILHGINQVILPSITPPPIDPTPAPIDSTTAPVDTTPVPVDPTAAPTTTAPVEPPLLSIPPFPIDPTPAPIDSTTAPVDTTPVPIDPTAAPTTTAPVEPPLLSIPPFPIDPTSAPIDSTTAPADATPAPIDPTAVSTTAPVDPTPVSFEPTHAPFGSTQAPTLVSSCQSIAEIVCTLPEFELLCSLVGDAGLASVLDGDDKFTLFAPINDAFTSLPPELANAVTSDPELLSSMLLTHAVAGEVLSTDLQCSGEVVMVSGEKTTSDCVDEKIFQRGSGNNTPDSIPEIIAPNGVACNGVIHAIDKVILPDVGGTTVDPTPFPADPISSVPTLAPSQVADEQTPTPTLNIDVTSLDPTQVSVDPTVSSVPTPAPSQVAAELTTTPTTTSDSCQSIAEVVCTLPEFELLCSLVGDAGLASVLDGDDKFTLFAPINDAFTSLPPELANAVTSDPELLSSILLTHAVAGEVLSTDLQCSGEVVMVSGEKTTSDCVDEKIFQRGSGNNTPDSIPEIIAPNGVACNGVIHAIDKVILPGTGDTPVDPELITSDPPEVLPTVRDVVKQFLLNGGAELEDADSYQSRALLRTASYDGAESFSQERLLQYYALYCIYYATNGVSNVITEANSQLEIPKWKNEEGWGKGDVEPCGGWHGISCDEEGKIKYIDLFRNELTGIFPPEVVLLSFDGQYATGAGKLERLDLTGNEWLFNGNDSSWISNLGGSMATISFEDTSFGGSLPQFPDSLVSLDISGAFFTDGLEDDRFEGLELLNFVDLDHNLFNGAVPSVFGRLPNLEYLYISGNSMTGDLSFMEGMPAIRELWVDRNSQLTGPLYDFIGDISTLESFSVTSSMLTGSIPESFGNFENMKQMWLSSNSLSGSIPASLGNLKRMTVLQVEDNLLTGSMPEDICAQRSDLLAVLGADCQDEKVECSCCSCCGLEECSDEL